MSTAQETDDEVEVTAEEIEETTEEVTEDAEIKAESEEDADELDIVVEGEEQPTSAPVRKSGFQKRFDKLNGKNELANDKLEAVELELESVKQQNKLLRLKDEVVELKRPKETDFETDSEFEVADDAYTKQEARKAAAEMLQEALTETSTQNTQQQTNDQQEKLIDAHYDRVSKLSIKPDKFVEVEDKAIAILGNDSAKAIMANTDDSALIMYALGLEKNAGKAEEFASLLKRNPIKALMEIGGWAKTLKVTPKTSTALDPETQIEPGTTVSKGERGPPGAKFW